MKLYLLRQESTHQNAPFINLWTLQSLNLSQISIWYLKLKMQVWLWNEPIVSVCWNHWKTYFGRHEIVLGNVQLSLLRQKSNPSKNVGLAIEGTNRFGLLESYGSETHTLEDMELASPNQRTLQSRLLRPTQKDAMDYCSKRSWEQRSRRKRWTRHIVMNFNINLHNLSLPYSFICLLKCMLLLFTTILYLCKQSFYVFRVIAVFRLFKFENIFSKKRENYYNNFGKLAFC